MLRLPLKLVLVVALGCLASCAAPTLPLPPPNAISTAPDADGIVTISGDALEGSYVSALNERTDRGVIGVADDMGHFELQLGAEPGDTIDVWQHVDADRGPSVFVMVPAPR